MIKVCCTVSWSTIFDHILGNGFRDVCTGLISTSLFTGNTLLISWVTRLIKRHDLCNKYHKPQSHFAQLLKIIHIYSQNEPRLEKISIYQLKKLINSHIKKYGTYNSIENQNIRSRQQKDVASPSHYSIRQLLIKCLERLPQNEGLDDIHSIYCLENEAEFENFKFNELVIPPYIQKKLKRSINSTIPDLIDEKLITSAEALAKLLPQITSGIKAHGIINAELRHLYSAIYQAFRRRRSLLLLDLQSQVKLEELPWIKAINRYRKNELSAKELAHETLKEISCLTLASFPQSIIPNKLLQEFIALSKTAQLEIPLVEELAVDIFMGDFSEKFVLATKKSINFIRDTIYTKYYQINYNEIETSISGNKNLHTVSSLFGGKIFPTRKNETPTKKLLSICEKRVGISHKTWDTVTNGMILEQMQIITTHNLSVLFLELHLLPSLKPLMCNMSKNCFKWICKRQQVQITDYHSGLIMLKQTAYAWRQMIFYLSFVEIQERLAFITWVQEFFTKQTIEFRVRFSSVLLDLIDVLQENSGYRPSIDSVESRVFLGWSKKHHLMPTIYNKP